MGSTVKDEYFDWLVEKISDENHKDCRKLLSLLDDIPFRWMIRNDENRAIDGFNLRYDFCDDHEYAYEMVDDELYFPCSVLEMLIGLASRCENQIMWDPDKGDRTHVWFWKFLDNLGISDETDTNWGRESVNKICRYVDNFMNREFFRDGFGGIFPLKHAKKDQRKVEIWYQLQAWLMENYDF